ncbi:MAG: hypothetical protein WDA47_01620, partial [Bacilli bacterium]
LKIKSKKRDKSSRKCTFAGNVKNGVLNDVAVAVAVSYVAVTRLEFVDKLLRINKAKKNPKERG